MNKIRLPKENLLLYYTLVPLSCLLFSFYICGIFWMFFSCLLAYLIQLTIPFVFIDSENDISYETTVRNKEELKKLDSKCKQFRLIVTSFIILTIILDTFPFWATSSSFCSNAIGLKIPKYEGGILVFTMSIITILVLLFIILSINNELKLPSKQYNQNIKDEEERRKRDEREYLLAKNIHERNVALYGEGYEEVCHEFVFNEKNKKLWLNKTLYSFEDILDAEIEDLATQHTTGGDIVTKTKTGSMIGRAVVGGVLTGGIGAIIGGATAKKESLVMPTKIHTIHRYNVLITTRNLSNPLITISCNDNSNLAQKCLATLKAIIHNK